MWALNPTTHSSPKLLKKPSRRSAQSSLLLCLMSESPWSCIKTGLKACQYALWLKSRSPTRVLKIRERRKKHYTIIKPSFEKERIQGNKIYIIILTRIQGRKFHTSRSWLRYFVGCESESICSPEKVLAPFHCEEIPARRTETISKWQEWRPF